MSRRRRRLAELLHDAEHMEREAEYKRAALIDALANAVLGASDARASLFELAAQFGAHRAAERDSVTTLLDELERLEGEAQRTFSQQPTESTQSAERNAELHARATPYHVHELCAALRRDALRGFSRTARHDVVNAIGAARNAVLLIAEDRNADDRRRFLEIAKRNLQLAEQLARAQFGEDTATVGGAGAPKLRRDERHDLRGASERDHLDTSGL